MATDEDTNVEIPQNIEFEDDRVVELIDEYSIFSLEMLNEYIAVLNDGSLAQGFIMNGVFYIYYSNDNNGICEG